MHLFPHRAQGLAMKGMKLELKHGIYLPFTLASLVNVVQRNFVLVVLQRMYTINLSLYLHTYVDKLG